MKSNLNNLLKKLIIPFFILGLAVIVFLMMVEIRSIDNLIVRNADFLAMQDNQMHLQQLRNQISMNEGTLHELIKTRDNKLEEELSHQIESSREILGIYESSNEDEYNQDKSDYLIKLLAEKAELQFRIIGAMKNGQRDQAEKLLLSPRNRDLQNHISSASNELLKAQKITSAKQENTIRANGKEVHTFSVTLVIAASILCLLVCAHVMTKKRHSENAEKKAKNAAKIKENFLANMSHEIRTPLNAILGFTNILIRSKLDEQQQKHVQTIHTSGNNLLAIVNDILDLSKIEAGMMRVEKAPFRLRDVMATVEDMLSPRAIEKDIKLIIKVDDDVPQVLCGDAARLTQIMVNLVSNAIKFTQEGGVYVKVTPFKSDGETIRLEFLVRDTGIGIPKDKQKYIFDRFEQAEAETTRRFGGTGLGLSIVKHLIELKKGTITLNSQEGAGTIFLVEIPFQLTNEVAPNPAINNNKKKIQRMNTDLNILVAEDNVMNQQLIKYLLKNWEFKFDLVFNGAQAVEALSKQKYDIVLMDIQMPEMDGHMATRKIRNDLRSAVPVVAMTAHAMAGEREKCLKSGMNDYISKPLNEEHLYEILIKYAKDCGKLNEGRETSQPPAAPKSVINLDLIERYSDDDKEFKKEILKEFVTRVPDNIDAMEKAIHEKDYSIINRVAHDMKTTVHFLGLTTLIGHLLQKIEEMALTGGALATIHQMFTDIKLVCMKAVEEAGQLIA